jgi:hypothetical protein
VTARLGQIVDQIIHLIPAIPEHWVPAVAGGYLDTEQTIELLQSWPKFLPIQRWTGTNMPFWIRHFARLHYSAIIVNSTLQREPSEADSHAAVRAASSLLTLSTNTPENNDYDPAVPVLTSLFLAGIVLSHSQYTFGTQDEDLISNFYV